jgi:hypothetical protein
MSKIVRAIDVGYRNCFPRISTKLLIARMGVGFI